MGKLDFVVAGVQKAGTTALDRYFRQHPQIGMADKKELHFFDKDTFRKSDGYGELESQIRRNENTVVTGEITPIYLYWETSMKRIWNYNLFINFYKYCFLFEK